MKFLPPSETWRRVDWQENTDNSKKNAENREARRCCETSLSCHQTTLRHVPQDCIIQWRKAPAQSVAREIICSSCYTLQKYYTQYL
jgi:hypothetical protein